MPANAEFGVLIADDEPAARRGVRQLLAVFPAFRGVGECRNGAEVLAALDRLEPDVVFLDVQMPGMDGFEVIRRRGPERMPAVVFLTAYDQFAIRAFDAQALDYLVKPVAEARFASTIRRLTKQLRGAAPGPGAGIVVTTSRGAVVLPFAEIDWIEAADNYARLWIGEKSYLLREPLRVLEDRARTRGFARAHRSALVRLSGVRALERGNDGEVVAVLSSGARVAVSRRCRAAFSAALRAAS